MKHIGLFEGIGGFSLAARWMGWQTVAWCEWNPFCQKVLSYHFPEAEQFSDITKSDFTKYHGTVDIITGGFPCQPYSLAGKQKGKEDERHLWPEMLRVIRQVAPRWVIGENVPGLVSWNDGLVFTEVQTDLEAIGYEVIAFNIPAAGVGAPHRRERVWFVAYASNVRCNNRSNNRQERHIQGNIWLATEDKPKWNRWQRWTGEVGEIRWNRPTKNTHTDGRGSEQWQSEPNQWQQRNTGAGDNEQLRTNHAETGAATDTAIQFGGWPGKQTEVDFQGWKVAQPSKKWNRVWGGLNPIGYAQSSTHTNSYQRCEGRLPQEGCEEAERYTGKFDTRQPWRAWENFPTQSPVCNGDDGLSAQLDAITFPKWRAESIKAGGNAIVPQVALQIFKAIEVFEEQLKLEAEV